MGVIVSGGPPNMSRQSLMLSIDCLERVQVQVAPRPLQHVDQAGRRRIAGLAQVIDVDAEALLVAGGDLANRRARIVRIRIEARRHRIEALRRFPGRLGDGGGIGRELTAEIHVPTHLVRRLQDDDRVPDDRAHADEIAAGLLEPA